MASISISSHAPVPCRGSPQSGSMIQRHRRGGSQAGETPGEYAHHRRHRRRRQRQYLPDTNHRRILQITPRRKVSTLVADARLIWCDALWIDDQGFLWMPAVQLNRIAGLNRGKQAVTHRFEKFENSFSIAANIAFAFSAVSEGNSLRFFISRRSRHRTLQTEPLLYFTPAAAKVASKRFES